ncbi:MAG: PfkB family carbohydrate kinase, partial [Mycobacterium sp.]
GSWFATPPPITPRSTVGAGDAALAGYVRAEVAGAAPPQRLQMAVAYGSAAAALPGSAQPRPADLDLDAVHVLPVTPTIPAANPKVAP